MAKLEDLVVVPANEKFHFDDHWREFTQDFSPGTLRFSPEQSRSTLVVDIPDRRVYDGIRQILGYHYVEGTQIRRVLPMQHPRWYGLFADEIQSAQWVRAEGNEAAPAGGTSFKASKIGVYRYLRCNVAFRSFNYDILDDTTATNETLRYLSRDQEPSEDAILQQAGNLTFAEGTGVGDEPTAGSTQFPQTIGLIQNKSMLTYTWHRVPEEFVTDDTGILPKFQHMIGRVNENTFLGNDPGTLLFRPPRIRRYEQSIINRKDFRQDFLLDITLNLQYFNPEPGVDPPFQRGHNMVPWWKTQRYYYATVDGTTTGNPIYRKGVFMDVFEHWSNPLS